MVELERKKKFKEGVSLALAFLVLSLFLFLTPTYLGNIIVTKVISTFFGIIVIGALGIELNKLNANEKAWGFDNLGIGLALGVL